MVESLLDTVLCIIHLTPMIPLCNGFYLFPLSRAVNSNSLIFDPSEFKIGLYVFIRVDIPAELTGKQVNALQRIS